MFSDIIKTCSDAELQEAIVHGERMEYEDDNGKAVAYLHDGVVYLASMEVRYT